MNADSDVRARSGEGARTAGALYLAVVLTGVFSLMYVPSQLSLGDAPVAMAESIRAHADLYRAGLAAWLVNQIAMVLLALALYRLLAGVDRAAAACMVALAVAGVPVGFVAAAHRLDALALATAATPFSAVEPALRAVLVAQSIQSWRSAITVVQAFWGLWLLPLGALLWRARLVPAPLCAALVLGGVGYVVTTFGATLSPAFGDGWIARVALLPAAAGEIGTCLWLLLRGAGPPAAAAARAVER